MKALNIPKTFLGFLAASLFFWLLMNLSKVYTSEVNFAIKYHNLDQDKLIQNEPQNNLSLQIKGSGFKLLGVNFSSTPLLISLKSLHKKSTNNYYLLTKNILPELQKQLKYGVSLLSASQDSIILNISDLKSKKVPIKPNLNITYEKGYGLEGAIKIAPDSIVISGAENDLKKVNEIETELLEINNLSENFSKKLIIKTPDKLKTKYKAATIKIAIDKFTEGKVDIPINIKNLPRRQNINIYPKKVTITYKVGLNNFSKVDENSFRVLCDYEHSKENNLSYLVPTLDIKSKYVSSVRIIPNKIDFLIHK